ncbi:MAG TPA: nucleotide exchange factor GrpE [Candidatus Didemnitutus sp.]|nr:nucleotide exchange factor GrpE [Candidatus Didemnitutus sp.]
MENEEEQTMEEQIEALHQQVEEWKDLAHRRSAEIANIQRRTQQERQDLMVYASEHVITKMLPVLDDLHAAVEAARKSTDDSPLKTGIEMIYAKAVKIFEDSGVNVIEAGVGEPFNVQFHEALMHTASEHPEGHVVQNVQRGYQLHDKVIRHAKVITSAGLPEHNETTEERT